MKKQYHYRKQYNGKHNDVSNLLLMTAYSNIGDINDDISNTLFLKACTNIVDADKGTKFIKSLESTTFGDIKFINTVIDFYGKVGDVHNAVNAFNNVFNY